MMTQDEWLSKIESVGGDPIWTEQEREQLFAVLTSPLMLKAFKHVLSIAEDDKNKMFGLNLSIPEQLDLAKKLQGQANGVFAALYQLFDLSKAPQEKSQ